MTYTVATLAVPPALFDLLTEKMKERGQHHRFFDTTGDNEKPELAIDFSGVALVADATDCRDDLINSGKLSDLLIAAGEEAFREGFEAGYYHDTERDGYTSYYPAWSDYTPSDAIVDLLAGLSKKASEHD